MEKINQSMDLRINRWRVYREQIKTEAKTHQKIVEESKAIENIKKQIEKIDASILKSADSTSEIITIPFKQSQTLNSINEDLNNIANQINPEIIQDILNNLLKDNVQILPQAAQDINNLEKLFENHKFPKNMNKIKRAIINAEEKHSQAKIDLRKNKNYITQIISDNISDKNRPFINLEKNEKVFKTKMTFKKLQIILSLMLVFFSVIGVIFMILWMVFL